ncbi:hypothetical protein EG68_00187 [Paragonimus skrjabini miyazakii]|uniref:Saposin B-type domain-containing protein n=1 Tax=Paragonimus skrjabini miyazakii TaxID=59628 RepID=A0A8S9Z4M2_9TREM|nr:hypothetical protein EG68_00187 [Paragonimus skrjabini miyazakii]
MHFLALLLSVAIVSTIANTEEPRELCRACQTFVNFVKVSKPDGKLWHEFCSDFHPEVAARKECERHFNKHVIPELKKLVERIGTEKACRAFC